MELLHTFAVLGAALLGALGGRALAVRLRQPAVMGEIVVGLLAGAAVTHLFGKDVLDALVPGPVLGWLKLVAEAGLVLYLAGAVRHLRFHARDEWPAVRWVALGSFLPSALTGLVLAAAVLLGFDEVRGDAPLPAFLLFLAVAMSITAVPVLIRILADRDELDAPASRLSLRAAIVIDAAGWLLLSVAVGLSAGSVSHFLRVMALFAAAGLVAWGIGLLLRRFSSFPPAAPRTAALVFGGVALAVAFSVEELGLTAIFGAVLVGVAAPASWHPVVEAVARVGRALMPAFFVVTGITILAPSLNGTPWALVALTVVLGVVGKIAGGYWGARLGGEPRERAFRVGALMNTRGLTEIVVVQTGYSAGLVSAPIVVALLVMALVTTAMTGPLVNLADRFHRVEEGQLP